MSDTTFIPLIVARQRKEAMTEDDKKLLTEFLGECWHTAMQGPSGKYYCSKLSCQQSLGDDCGAWRRTFVIWQDLGDLKDKLVEKGMFEKFYVYAVKNWAYEPRSSDFTQWLLNPAVFIPLVVEFLKKEKA